MEEEEEEAGREVTSNVGLAYCDSGLLQSVVVQYIIQVRSEKWEVYCLDVLSLVILDR